jgi:hypothetical protein
MLRCELVSTRAAEEASTPVGAAQFELNPNK